MQAMQCDNQAQARTLADELRDIEIRFIPHADFADSDAVHSILESTLPERTLPTLVRSSVGLQVPQVPLLTPAEEQHLFLKMNCLRSLANDRRNRALRGEAKPIDLRTVQNLLAQADAVRQQISDANQRLVLKIASGFFCTRTDTLDFVSEANMVLLKAIDKFDASRGFRFSTYATHSLRRHLARVWHRGSRHPSCNETDVERIATTDPEISWINAEIEARIPQLLSELSPRDREIVQRRFGLDGSVPMRYRELGLTVGLSAERVRQIILRACSQLKEKYAVSFGLDR